MSGFASYAIAAWVLLVIIAFPSFPPPRGILVILFSGALFLPEAVPNIIELGPIKLGKLQAIGYAGLLAALLYDSARFSAWRPGWYDWPMIVWCGWPMVSALLNDPPPDGSSSIRDGVSQSLSTAMVWGAPYCLGRVYFADRPAIRDLALGTVIAAAIYTPLCLWESRMSPHLHTMVYGYNQHSFGQSIRYGGYRPLVFMQHGLAVGFFMAAGALLGVWLRRPADLPRATLLLVPVAVWMKSTGAIVLGLVGGVVLWLARTTCRRGWLIALVAVPPTYVAARTTGLWSGTDLVELVASNVEKDRAQSLDFRLMNENMLVAKALERPLAGWGGWGRNRVFNREGRDISVTDGLWVIVLGDRGLIGISLLGATLLLPVLRFAQRTDPRGWGSPDVAPAVGCALVVTLWVIDCLFNAMMSPVYVVMAGALAGWEPESVADGGPPVAGYHPNQEQSVPGVPASQPAWLAGDAVEPLQPELLHPPRGPSNPASDEVEGRP